MLDSKELARRFKRAMQIANPPISDADLARACEVEPQAVTGWRKTGRVAKRHLPVISRMTGCGVDYLLGVVDEPKVDQASQLWSKYCNAPPAVREAIDILLSGKPLQQSERRKTVSAE